MRSNRARTPFYWPQMKRWTKRISNKTKRSNYNPNSYSRDRWRNKKSVETIPQTSQKLMITQRIMKFRSSSTLITNKLHFYST